MGGGSAEAVAVFVAAAEIQIELTAEFGLVAGQFDDAPGIAFEVGVWIESVAQEHLPAFEILPFRFGAVPAMLDGAGNDADIAVDVAAGAVLPGAAGGAE